VESKRKKPKVTKISLGSNDLGPGGALVPKERANCPHTPVTAIRGNSKKTNILFV
jgi:hypothetical protein